MSTVEATKLQKLATIVHFVNLDRIDIFLDVLTGKIERLQKVFLKLVFVSIQMTSALLILLALVGFIGLMVGVISREWATVLKH